MKIIVKRTEWHRLIGGDCGEEMSTHEFDNIDTSCQWYDWGESYLPEGKNVKGALPRKINFSFKVNQINEDSVVLEVGGDAGLTLKDIGENIKTRLIVLRLNEEKSFQTHTYDCGVGYDIMLENSREERVERLKFLDFNHLFIVCPFMFIDKEQVSMFSPIIYSMEDRYYNAVVKFLQTGEMTDLHYKKFGIFDIMEGYWHNKNDKENYLKALIILNNIEKVGEDDSWVIFRPDCIE